MSVREIDQDDVALLSRILILRPVRRPAVGPRTDAPSELPVNPMRVRSRKAPNFWRMGFSYMRGGSRRRGQLRSVRDMRSNLLLLTAGYVPERPQKEMRFKASESNR